MTFDLLFNRRWPKSSLANDLAEIDATSYSQAYQSLKKRAPTRPHGRPYLGGRTGYPTTEGKTNRREEHFAIAMVNLQNCWLLPDGTRFELLDYQVPLKAARSDREIGKIDMFGVTEHGRALLVELKVIGHSGGPSDPPPVALLEGLRYASVVEANLERLAEELRGNFGRDMILERPDIVILGEADWWSRWLFADEGAKSVLEEKAKELSQALGVSIVFATLPNTQVEYGNRSKAPRLADLPRLEYPHSLPRSAVKAPNGLETDPRQHEALLQTTWWSYAKTLTEDDLDGHERSGRPPVVSPQKPSLNLMLPCDKRMALEIEAEIQKTSRHKHFGSFRSSQAIAQSVFGAFKAAGRLDLLSRIPAECGRPAFGGTSLETKLSMEVHVQTLNEPRPTQLDVCLETDDYRVAVECKFCEPVFSKCSRVVSKTSEPPICDGTYTLQQGRNARCALSEIGVSYWGFIPELFDWSATQDLSPCPLMPTYQIVRNVLAAVVDTGGCVDPSKGHAVFVYDGRNPAYKLGGVADFQLRQATSACRFPGLIRRVTWQEIIRVCQNSADLIWLPKEMNKKHGIFPSP